MDGRGGEGRGVRLFIAVVSFFLRGAPCKYNRPVGPVRCSFHRCVKWAPYRVVGLGPVRR